MISYTFSTKVFYKDIDKMGIVYYSRYLEFFEQARTETLNNINLKIKDLEILGFYLPVIKVECIYLKSVRLEDIINIKCRIFSIPKSKLRFDYDVLKNNEKVKVAFGYTEHAFLNIKKNKPAKPPTSLLKKINFYF